VGELGRSGVAAVKWSAFASAGRFLLQLLAQVVLARTLGPDAFGVFAIGMVILTFANFVSGFGFSWNLLQRKTLHEEDIRFAWTWQCIAGAIAMAGVFMSAPFLSEFFHEPRAQWVIEWLSVACLLGAANAPANYLLQRDLNFRAVGLIQVGSYAVGYLAVGVPMALLGYGITSLVAAWMVQTTVVLVASYVLKPHALRPLLWYPEARASMGVGRTVFLTNIVNWLLNNLDRLIIGRLLNAEALGLYNMVYNLATLPNSLLVGALQPAFMAAGARLQDELQRLGRVYFQMLSTIFVLAVPAFVFLALISNDLVALLYGPKWKDAGAVLSILFLAMPAYVVWGLSTPVLWNTGRRHYEYALQIPLVILGALGFYFFSRQGIGSAATVAALLLVLRALVMSTAAIRALGLRGTTLLPQMARGLLLSAVCCTGVVLSQIAVARFQMPLLSLVASTLSVLLPLGLLLVLRPQILGDQTAGMVLRFFPRLTSFLKRGVPAPLSKNFSKQAL
jgi:lipopolysaccharide exporter